MHRVNLSMLRALLPVCAALLTAPPAKAQAKPNIDSCKTVWKNAALTLDERAKALSHVLYADTTVEALERAWALLGKGNADPQDPVWRRAYAEDAMAKGRRRGQHDDHEGAAKWFAIAAARYETIGNKRFGTEAHRWCGYALNNLGRFGEAAPHLMAAERGYKELKDSTGITDVCCSLGYAFAMQENYHLAKTQFLRGLSFSHGRDDQWEFTMLYKIAECEFDGGHYDSARVYLERARDFMRHHDVEDFDETVMSLDADLALRDKHCDEALAVYRHILDDMRKQEFGADRIGNQMLYVADAYTCSQRHEEAYSIAQDALLIAERIGMLELQERALRTMANAKEKLGDAAEALRLQKRMLAIRDSLDRNESLSVLGRSLLGLEVEEQLRADSLSAALAISEARATADRSRTQRIILIALTAVILIVAALLVNRYRLKRRLQVAQLRARLSRDLHDDIGSTLSSISILSSVARKRAEAGDSAGAAASLAGISERSQRLQRNMNDIVWSVDPSKDSMEELLDRMREFCGAVLEPKGIAFHFEASGDLPASLSAETKSNLYLLFKEAMNNAAKHANASQVEVRIRKDDDGLHMTITDDGTGLSTGRSIDNGGGNGMRNMRQRAAEMKAELRIGPGKEQGVIVELSLRA